MCAATAFALASASRTAGRAGDSPRAALVDAGARLRTAGEGARATRAGSATSRRERGAARARRHSPSPLPGSTPPYTGPMALPSIRVVSTSPPSPPKRRELAGDTPVAAMTRLASATLAPRRRLAARRHRWRVTGAARCRCESAGIRPSLLVEASAEVTLECQRCLQPMPCRSVPSDASSSSTARTPRPRSTPTARRRPGADAGARPAPLDRGRAAARVAARPAPRGLPRAAAAFVDDDPAACRPSIRSPRWRR